MGTRHVRWNPLSDVFNPHRTPMLIARTLRQSTMTVTEVGSDRPNFGSTETIPRDDAYLIALQVRACPDHGLWFDVWHAQPQNYAAGVTTIYDLRRNPIAEFRNPFHTVMFYLPRKVLDSVAEEAGWISERART